MHIPRIIAKATKCRVLGRLRGFLFAVSVSVSVDGSIFGVWDESEKEQMGCDGLDMGVCLFVLFAFVWVCVCGWSFIVGLFANAL